MNPPAHQPCRFYDDSNAANYGTASDVSDLQTAMQTANGNISDAQADIVSLGTSKANASDLSSLATTVAGKCDTADFTDLSTTVAGKVSQADFNDLVDTVSAKATAADLADLSNVVNGLSSGKADAGDFADLQSSVSSLATSVANIGADETAIAALESYKQAVKNLCLALQNSMELNNPLGDPFDWSALVA